MLEVRALGRAFGRLVVLDGCSLLLKSAEVVVVRGANGAGKSTLLRCIVGLDSPGSGAVTIAGSPPNRAIAKRALTYFPDHPVLFDELTVRDNALFAAQAFSEPNPAVAVERMIATFGLRQHADVAPPALSRGLRQRAALCRGFSRPWSVAILDEPFNGLDREGRTALIDYVRSAVAEGRSALVASHDTDADRLATRTVELVDGRIRPLQ